tara:strand:- start:886 stop:1506 length:621 start_codon:yes stop_codon:yes gene_type:complete
MTKEFLHVGCGSARKANTTPIFNTEEWNEIRLDIDEAAKPDIVASLTDMSVIKDATYDAVYSSHNIEHLYAYQVPQALLEIRRVLKEDGYFIVTCPDLESVCKVVADGNLVKPLYQSPAGPISAIDILYGLRPSLAKGNHYMAHNVGFNKELLHTTLRECGFASAAVASWSPTYVLWGIAYKNTKKNSEELKEELIQHTSHTGMKL